MAPVADSQRSLTHGSKRARARIAKGGGLIAHYPEVKLDERVPAVNIEISEPTLQPGMAERAIDTATDLSRTITEVSAGLQAAVNRLSEAVATARKPVCRVPVRHSGGAQALGRWATPQRAAGTRRLVNQVYLPHRVYLPEETLGF